ncbi:MAG: hypothetical protein AAF559_10215 [Pseudomonadota bacterium]
MIRTLFILSPLALTLAACSEGPAEEEAPAKPTANEMKAVLAEEGPTLSPPNRDLFAEKLAAACPALKPVKNADCRAQGMGSHDFTCKYGLGKDEYLRYEGVLAEVEGEYVLQDTDTVCAQGA